MKKKPVEIEPITSRVMVDNKYTYETMLDVGVGDVVELPSTRPGQTSWQGTVTSMVSTYTGPCKPILKIVSKSKS